MAEQKRNALAIMRAPARFGQRGADVNRLELVALLFLAAVGHRVRDDDSSQPATVESLDGVAAENAVGDDGHDFPRAVFHERVGGLCQRPTRVGHVVDQDSHPVFNISDQHHSRDFVGAIPLFVNQGKSQIKSIGHRGGSGRRCTD